MPFQGRLARLRDSGPMRRGGGYIAIEGRIRIGKISLAQAPGLTISAKSHSQLNQEISQQRCCQPAPLGLDRYRWRLIKEYLQNHEHEITAFC